MTAPARRRLFLPLALLVGLLSARGAGCQETAVFEGRFESGFETSAFYPCDADEPWWVHADSAAWARLHAPPARRDTAGYLESVAYVRIRGEVGPPGEYGHMGAYRRELHVTEVVGIWDPEEKGCPD